MSQYEKNYRLLKAKFSGVCSVCEEEIYPPEQIWWHKFSKKVVHNFCLKQPLKRFKTKYTGYCKECKKRIYKGAESYYHVDDGKLCCISCANILESKFLTEKQFHFESFENIVNKISKQLKKKIVLQYDQNSETNYCQNKGHEFLVVLNGDMPMDSAFFHELGHVLYTGNSATSMLLFRIEFESILKQKLGRNLTDEESKDVFEIVHEAYNVMEDIRIEYLVAKNSTKIKEIFDDSCIVSGKKWTKEDEVPCYPHGYLLAKRFFRDDLIPKKSYKEISELYDFCLYATEEELLKKLFDWFLYGSMGECMVDRVISNSQ